MHSRQKGKAERSTLLRTGSFYFALTPETGRAESRGRTYVVNKSKRRELCSARVAAPLLTRITTTATGSRQSLHRMHPGDGSRHRKFEVVLPVHSARRSLLGCHGTECSGRHAVPRRGSKAPAACGSKRLLLRTGPDEWQGAAGKEIYQPAHVGERNRAGRPSAV